MVGQGVFEVDSELSGAVAPEGGKRGGEGGEAMEVLASVGVLGVLSSVFHWDILSPGVGGGASSFSWSSMS